MPQEEFEIRDNFFILLPRSCGDELMGTAPLEKRWLQLRGRIVVAKHFNKMFQNRGYTDDVLQAHLWGELAGSWINPPVSYDDVLTSRAKLLDIIRSTFPTILDAQDVSAALQESWDWASRYTNAGVISGDKIRPYFDATIDPPDFVHFQKFNFYRTSAHAVPWDKLCTNFDAMEVALQLLCTVDSTFVEVPDVKIDVTQESVGKMLLDSTEDEILALFELMGWHQTDITLNELTSAMVGSLFAISKSRGASDSWIDHCFKTLRTKFGNQMHLNLQTISTFCRLFLKDDIPGDTYFRYLITTFEMISGTYLDCLNWVLEQVTFFNAFYMLSIARFVREVNFKCLGYFLDEVSSIQFETMAVEAAMSLNNPCSTFLLPTRVADYADLANIGWTSLGMLGSKTFPRYYFIFKHGEIYPYNEFIKGGQLNSDQITALLKRACELDCKDEATEEFQQLPRDEETISVEQARRLLDPNYPKISALKSILEELTRAEDEGKFFPSIDDSIFSRGMYNELNENLIEHLEVFDSNIRSKLREPTPIKVVGTPRKPFYQPDTTTI